MHQERRVALITGVTGQDGAYLAEYLLGLGSFLLQPRRDQPLVLELLTGNWVRFGKTRFGLLGEPDC